MKVPDRYSVRSTWLGVSNRSFITPSSQLVPTTQVPPPYPLCNFESTQYFTRITRIFSSHSTNSSSGRYFQPSFSSVHCLLRSSIGYHSKAQRLQTTYHPHHRVLWGNKVILKSTWSRPERNSPPPLDNRTSYREECSETDAVRPNLAVQYPLE